MDLKDIKAIIDLMKKNSISEFELERQDFKIRLKRGGLNGAGVAGGGGGSDEPAVISVPSAPPMVAIGGGGMMPGGQIGSGPTSGEIEIKSPMIGTFYRAPSPESANYIEVGAEVNPETVVCIIEAMKVMNEIKAEVRGVITQVLVDNAKPVEFGQTLFKVRPV